MGATILIVEDNRHDRSLVAFLLGAFGHATIVSASGVDAIESARDVAPDLVLMDILMPDMDGYETMRQLRTLPSLGSTPIIALTAIADPAERQRALDAGFDGYMTKPIIVTDFASQVDRWIPADRQSVPPSSLAGLRSSP
ncbi:MAG: two-component system, cell cycle response regulator DivK [bacterium]|jgi:CheY-like chemotaxis protein